MSTTFVTLVFSDDVLSNLPRIRGETIEVCLQRLIAERVSMPTSPQRKYRYVGTTQRHGVGVWRSLLTDEVLLGWTDMCTALGLRNAFQRQQRVREPNAFLFLRSDSVGRPSRVCRPGVVKSFIATDKNLDIRYGLEVLACVEADAKLLTLPDVQ